MMDIFKQNKKLFIILAVVILVFVGYGMLDREPQQNVIQKQSITDSSPVEQEILQLLLDVQSITLDSTIFRDPAFDTLRDFGREIVPEPTGRVNPFISPEFEPKAVDEQEAESTQNMEAPQEGAQPETEQAPAPSEPSTESLPQESSL